MSNKNHLVVLISCVVFAICCAPVTAQLELPEDIAESMHLSSGFMLELDIDAEAGQSLVVDIEFDGSEYELELHPINVRSDKFVLKEQLADGSLRSIAPPASRTVSGALRGDKGSKVVGSVLDGGLAARISMSDGTIYFVEPMVFDDIDVQGANVTPDHVMYRPDQVRPVDTMCGNAGLRLEHYEAIQLRNQRARRDRLYRRNSEADDFAFGTAGPGPGIALAEIGIDTDFEFFSAYGSTQATMDRIELIVNMVNDQFEDEVAISHQITAIIIRSNSNDPYVTSDFTPLLAEVSEEWLTNQTDIPRDIVHMFTGKFTPGVGGAAFLGGICSSTLGFGFSSGEALDLPLSCNVQIGAHELGHNWGANHCSCPDNTMNASVNCSSSFSAETRDVITTLRNTRPCLEFTAPANDQFENSIEIASLPASITGANRGAGIEGGEPDLESSGATVWWNAVAPGTGLMHIDTAGSNFDTELHVFEAGASSAVADLLPVASNDDFQDTLQSGVTFPVVAGQRYEIRVSGVLVGVNNVPRMGEISMSVGFTDAGPVDFFWSSIGLDSGAANESNAAGDFMAGSSGSLFLYYDAMLSDIATGAFIDVETSEDGVIEFTSAETLEFDILVSGSVVGPRWGDAVGSTGTVEPNFIDELGAFTIVSGSGMTAMNTGPVFFDQGFDFGVNAFLFARIDFDVVGEAGDTVNLTTGPGATGIVHEGQLLAPLIGSYTIGVSESKILVGDVNCDGAINLLDVAPFVDLISNGTFSDKADINGDGQVDLLDVEPFILLLNG